MINLMHIHNGEIIMIYNKNIKIIFLLRKLIIILVILISFISSNEVFADTNLLKEIENYNKIVLNNYEYIASALAVYSTDYWHYSKTLDDDNVMIEPGYWLDSKRKEKKIYDTNTKFWKEPELYYSDHPGMRIIAEAILPDSVKKCIENRVEIVFSVKPKKPDAINLSTSLQPSYVIIDNVIQIHALPLFRIDTRSYRSIFQNIDETIPIVAPGYGWNLYSLFKEGVHAGPVGSAFGGEDDIDQRLEFSEIADITGAIRSNKIFSLKSEITGMEMVAHASELTIGDILNDTFNTAGAVGMWFQYDFEIEFYREPAKTDLSVTAIDAADPVAAGTRTQTKVTVKNDSEINYFNASVGAEGIAGAGTGGSAGAGAVSLSFAAGGNTEVKSIELAAGASKQVTFEWTAPDAAPQPDGRLTLTAAVNPDKAIEETDYDNNSRELTIRVTDPDAAAGPATTPAPTPEPPPSARNAILPDLAIVSHRPGAQKRGTQSRSYVKIRNTHIERIEDVEIKYEIAGGTYTKRISAPPLGEAEVPFDWPAPDERSVIYAQVTINPGREIAESNYANNSGRYPVQITEPDCDLSVTAIIPERYRPGLGVVSLVRVKNQGERDIQYADSVTVKLNIPAIGYNESKTISIAKTGEIDIPFSWTAPAAGHIDLIAEVNPEKSVIETNYANNTMIQRVSVESNPDPRNGCDIYRRDWSERREVRTEERTIIRLDGTVNVIRVPIYENVGFYAEVSLSIKLNPEGTMKSGYGIECEVTTNVRSNYDNPSMIEGIQQLHVYLPNSKPAYSDAIELERVPGTANKWRFPVNPASVIGSRNVYVPVNWPDDKYFEISFTGREGQSPGGVLCVTKNASVYIKGNMYEDDHTYSW